MLKHASVMIHDPLINSGIGGNALRIQSISEDLMRIREIMGNILAEHTGKTLEEIYEKTAKDTYFYAEEAVAYGLADKIIERL
jgi:ATP-dependent Clp protease protease subunit